MSNSLRDDLASLRIDRADRKSGNSRTPRLSDEIDNSDANSEAPPPESRRRTQASQSQSYRKRGRGRGLGILLFTLILWLIPLSLLAGVGYFGYQQYEKVRPRHEVRVAVVQKMTSAEAEKLLSAKGYLRSNQQAAIGARTPGRVQQLKVIEGQKVTKGDVLAILEHDDLIAQLESRKALKDRTAAELVEAKANLDNRRRREERVRRLYASKSISIDEVDTAMIDRETSQAKVQALDAGMRWMQSQVDEIAENIKNMHIYAPFDGTVLTKDAEIGETITPGGMGANSGRGSVVMLADLNHLEVETDVAEGLLGRLQIGQPAEISISAVPDKRYRGKLKEIIKMGDRSRGTVKVNVAVLDPDDRLFPELAGTVHFLPMGKKDGEVPKPAKPEIYVPRDALWESNGHTQVWIVTDDNRLQARRIEIIAAEDALRRVESGLEGGERVVLKPTAEFQDGELVKIAE